MEWITQDKNHNPIRHINTGEVKLSEKEIEECVKSGIKMAYSLTSNPCVTVIEMEIFKAVKRAINKPRISK
jgi:hypothetical protein